MSKNQFNIIDRIFLINLPERTDRLMDAMYECEKIGIKSRVEVIEGIKKGHTGLIESTIQILSGVEPDQTILILEDDVKFINNPQKIFRQAYEQIRYENWDMLYLGALTRQRVFKRYPSWYRLKYGYCAHAIIYNPKVIPVVLSLFRSYKNKTAVNDRLLAEVIQPLYTCLLIDPMIAVQRPGYSDLEGKELDYDLEKRFQNIQSYGRER